MTKTVNHDEAITEIIEAALEQATEREPTTLEAGRPVVGEVLDTHHPHLPGRIFVKWVESESAVVQRWVQVEQSLHVRIGQRVILMRPVGWPDWIVMGALRSTEPGEAPIVQGPQVVLAAGEAVHILGHDGTPLVRVSQGDRGPCIELCTDHVELKAPRRLSLCADTVEIRSGHGGVDVRTDGDAVVRARNIRLN